MSPVNTVGMTKPGGGSRTTVRPARSAARKLAWLAKARVVGESSECWQGSEMESHVAPEIGCLYVAAVAAVAADAAAEDPGADGPRPDRASVIAN